MRAGPNPTACLGCCVACRNDNQINNRLVLLLSRSGRERTVFWKDIVAGDLVKVGQLSSGCGWCQTWHSEKPHFGSNCVSIVCMQQERLEKQRTRAVWLNGRYLAHSWPMGQGGAAIINRHTGCRNIFSQFSRNTEPPA